MLTDQLVYIIRLVTWLRQRLLADCRGLYGGLEAEADIQLSISSSRIITINFASHPITSRLINGCDQQNFGPLTVHHSAY